MKKAQIEYLGFEWTCPYCGKENTNDILEYSEYVILKCWHCDADVELYE